MYTTICVLEYNSDILYVMAMRSFRRFGRHHYFERERQRRIAGMADPRRIDVTLRGEMLDDYAIVRCYLDGLNRLAAEHKILGFPIRLSHTQIIKVALSRAAKDILREDNDAAKTRKVRARAY